MEKRIACCGLDCTNCDIRIATVNNDEGLKAGLAKKIKEHHNMPDITPDMVNCKGCRDTDGKTIYLEKCRIRKCVKANKFYSCAECEMLIDCQQVGKIHQYDPSALDNLRLLVKLIR